MEKVEITDEKRKKILRFFKNTIIDFIDLIYLFNFTEYEQEEIIEHLKDIKELINKSEINSTLQMITNNLSKESIEELKELL